jgi:hypothetical protein
MRIFLRPDSLRCGPTAHVTSPFALPRISEMRLEAAVCPFSVQPAKKLVQKIHRLTDN